MSYYRPGDEVVFSPKGYGAKILKALPGDEYIVEFDDNTIIPPQMQIPGQYLIPKPIPTLWGGTILGAPVISSPSSFTDAHCPRCGSKWKETWIGHKPYYDCIKCNLKKEDA